MKKLTQIMFVDDAAIGYIRPASKVRANSAALTNGRQNGAIGACIWLGVPILQGEPSISTPPNEYHQTDAI
jgi:hypothetical protein